MELACQLWPGEPVHWQGQFRPPITGQHLEPTPVQRDRLPFWVGGGSSPETAKLAGRLGLNLMLPSAFGKPDKFAPVADIYREAFAEAGHAHAPRVGACWHGWVGKTDAIAARTLRTALSRLSRLQPGDDQERQPEPAGLSHLGVRL